MTADAPRDLNSDLFSSSWKPLQNPTLRGRREDEERVKEGGRQANNNLVNAVLLLQSGVDQLGP